MRTSLIIILCLLSSACAHSPSYDPQDPLESANRRIFAFNEKVDKYVATPLAKTYVAGVPAAVRTGVHNFLGNLGYPTVIVNDMLQGKLGQAGRDTGRLLMNTTFGLAGFLDPATLVGLERNYEDFGQTLGVWGLGQGWYLTLPFLGPSTNRDLVGRGADIHTAPVTYAETNPQLAVFGAGLVDQRAQLLGSEGLVKQQFDPYVFVRGLYLERRHRMVYDEHPPIEDFEDFDK